ncbi:hypothetical protein [Oceanobacillus picturae]|uniref:hypothetical protein n=1 Tax=Oceanobacillus picturae TaxID=171693 RepID=UPI000E69E96A|nr:hypothetical protein [Oceanobacillus picturae]RIU93424.1 hypothetical protein D1864_08135 [Oceanobacillus picturae]
MTNPESAMNKEKVTIKQAQFLNRFATIAKEVMNEYQQNTQKQKQTVMKVKIPNQVKEELE